MKKNFIFIVQLLPFVAAAAFLAWLLPVRVAITILIFCQAANISIFGELLKWTSILQKLGEDVIAKSKRETSDPSDRSDLSESSDHPDNSAPHEQA